MSGDADPSMEYMESVYPDGRMNQLQWEYEMRQTTERERVIFAGEDPGERVPPPANYAWRGSAPSERSS